jgi:hypothetical protein
MKTQADKMLDHLRKYTLSTDQICAMSDLEYQLHCMEAENNYRDIHEDDAPQERGDANQ